MRCGRSSGLANHGKSSFFACRQAREKLWQAHGLLAIQPAFFAQKYNFNIGNTINSHAETIVQASMHEWIHIHIFRLFQPEGCVRVALWPT
jgi:hypothetical protein